jgi:hypothetical protein
MIYCTGCIKTQKIDDIFVFGAQTKKTLLLLA